MLYTYHTVMENDTLPPGVYGDMASFLVALQDGRHCAAWEASQQSAATDQSYAHQTLEEEGWRDLACIEEATRTRRRRWWLAVPSMLQVHVEGHAS